MYKTNSAEHLRIRKGVSANYDLLFVLRACTVREAASQILMRHSDIRTCFGGENFVTSEQLWIWVCPIGTTATPCLCRVHVQS